MDVEQIIKEHLEKIGADGLRSDDCTCEIDDLVPCYVSITMIKDCKPAKIKHCKECELFQKVDDLGEPKCDVEFPYEYHGLLYCLVEMEEIK